MDLQTGLLCLGVVVLSTIIIYVISMFGMKEKTYEEAIAEQRKMPEENLLLGRSAKEKSKEKKLKKQGKKVKEKADKESSSSKINQASPPVKVHVDFEEPEAEVVSENSSQDSRKKKKKEKVKPILLNKSEKSIIVDSPVGPMNHFEEILPKDDLLKRKGSQEDVRNLEPKVSHQKNAAQDQPKVASVSVKAATSVKNEKVVANAKVEKSKKVEDKITPVKVEKVAEKIKNEKIGSKIEDLTASDKQSLTKLEKSVKVEKIENKSNIKSRVKPNAEKKPVKETTTAKIEVKKNGEPDGKKTDAKSVSVKDEVKQVSKNEKVEILEPNEKADSNVKLEKEVPPTKQGVNSKPAKEEPVAVRSKKKRSELAALQQISGDHEGVNVNLLMPLVRKAELSRSEIQILIELLLNKQQGPAVVNSEWIEGRQDPVVKLKKQLAEKEKALNEEVQASQSFHNKLKELRSEYNTERSRLSHSCRQLEEALVLKQAEVQSLNTRLQHAHDTLNAEKANHSQQMQQLQAKLNEEHLLMRKLQEEQSQFQNVHQDLLNHRQQMEIHLAHINEQHQETEASLKSQIGQLHAQLQEQENINGSINVELQNLRDKQLAEISILREHNSQFESKVILLEKQTAASSRRHEELNLIHAEMEQVVKQKEVELQYEKTKSKESIDNLSNKYAALVDIKSEASRLQNENEKLGAQLSSLKLDSQHYREENEKLHSKLLILEELQQEAQQLREENESLAAQVTAVTERPAAEGRENGDLQYSDEKVSASFIFKEKESNQSELLNKLNEDLLQKESALEKLASEVSNYKTEISRINEELEIQKRKNDDLRKKNWKAMEALSTMEKSLQSKTKDSETIVSEVVLKAQLEEQSAFKIVLQRIFPEVKVEDCKAYQIWLDKFEKQASNIILRLKSQSQEVVPTHENLKSSALIELEKQNTQLQALVVHYKSIIEDTEGMLKKFQNHVEEEETKWRQQLLLKERELTGLREERDRLHASQNYPSQTEEDAREVCGVEFAFSCIEKSLPLILTEMQSKLQTLQSKYESEQEEKKKLSETLDSLYGDCRELQEKLTENNKFMKTVEKLEEEKCRLILDLESERLKNTELSQELSKVKSLVNTAKDFLLQEREKADDIQLSNTINGINTSHNAASNGPNAGSTVTESIPSTHQPFSETTEKRLKHKKKKGGSGRK